MLKMQTVWSPNRVQNAVRNVTINKKKQMSNVSQFKNFINFLSGLCQDIDTALIKAVRCIAFCNILPWDQHHINS